MGVMSIPKTKSYAFFGSTGGCANACLRSALQNGYKCRALVRTPEKLKSMLKDGGITDTLLDSKLTVIKGDVRDVEAVTSTLVDENHEIISWIVSGIGASPVLQMSLTLPVTVADGSVCEAMAASLLIALKNLKNTLPTFERPSIVAISTTGISDGPEDVPFGYRILYHYTLKVPHQDKKNMEVLLSQPSSFNYLSSVIILRPTILTGSASGGKGYKAVIVGTDKKPVQGYWIVRADVGEWAFEEILNGKRELPKGTSYFTLTE